MSAEIFRIGFLPLVDAALPILARELGFAEAAGIEIELVRDVTWAAVRDRLLYGHTEAAHLVAPLAIATALGRDRPAVPMAVPIGPMALKMHRLEYRRPCAHLTPLAVRRLQQRPHHWQQLASWSHDLRHPSRTTPSSMVS